MVISENDDFIGGGNCPPEAQFDDGHVSSVISSDFFLDRVGQVNLTLNPDGLSWKLVESLDNGNSTCLGIKLTPDTATEIKLSETYAVELINRGLIRLSYRAHAGQCLEDEVLEMYRFTVHGIMRSKAQSSPLKLITYTFGNENLETCQLWVNRLNTSLGLELGRPQSLLVFVNPKSGKGKGYRTWESVRTIFWRAKVETKVIVTERAGHAFDVMSSISNKELTLYDGVIAVGGDGFFNEILNGFLTSRHKALKPPMPSDIVKSAGDATKFLFHNSNEMVVDTPQEGEDLFPLLSNPEQNGTALLNTRAEESSVNLDSSSNDIEPSYFDGRFRFGIIPAGSTDAIVICTTGTRDSITSALQIVLGKRVHLDIAQVVRWKATPTSEIEPTVRYAASFAGYGFYGDVITESEKYRWMGPRRYDFAGTKVFLRHRSYDAEVAYVDVEAEDTNPTSEQAQKGSWIQGLWSSNVSEKSKCRVNCKICGSLPIERTRGNHHKSTNPYSRPEEAKWLRSKGRFLSIGAAIISCRNERAPDGLVADAHLADGFLHLILIRDCPHAAYLWHLTQLARKGGDSLNFKFVEHHKTPAFTFTSFGEESVWNLDGELFPAHQLSAQVFRGLVCLFASGPEV